VENENFRHQDSDFSNKLYSFSALIQGVTTHPVSEQMLKRSGCGILLIDKHEMWLAGLNGCMREPYSSTNSKKDVSRFFAEGFSQC